MDRRSPSRLHQPGERPGRPRGSTSSTTSFIPSFRSLEIKRRKQRHLRLDRDDSQNQSSNDLSALRFLRDLEKELAVSQAIWKIPFFHHPIYSSGRKHGSDLRLRRELEPLFTRYGVRVALSGHDHIYERIKPQEGVIYFVSGSGGQLRKGDIKRDDPLFAAGNIVAAK
jgi:3',5'-cyclic AMP phosphodiesterase CpdA